MSEILPAVRRACLSRMGVPVVCGASLRGIGVEPLLDSITTFLPSPLDRPRPIGKIQRSSNGVTTRKGNGRRARKGAGGSGAAVEVKEDGQACAAVLEVDPLQDGLVALVFKV